MESEAGPAEATIQGCLLEGLPRRRQVNIEPRPLAPGSLHSVVRFPTCRNCRHLRCSKPKVAVLPKLYVALQKVISF